MNDVSVIYKICSRQEWDEATSVGLFLGSAVDLKDGFIHFSAPHQTRETAAKHFAGQSDLVLISIETSQHGDQLRWEESRGGDLFPHLYAPLPTASATSVVELPLDIEGKHQFPDGF